MNSISRAPSRAVPELNYRERLFGKIRCFAHSLGHLIYGSDSHTQNSATASAMLIDHLQGRIAELERQTETDELTGLLNRRGFDKQLQRVLSGVERYDEQGVLIYIDLDAFKPINDSYGHAAGDEVLRHVANLLSDGIRDTDFVGRLGGDEFAILLTHSNWENGLRRAERIENQLNKSIVHWQGRMIAISASFGLQEYGDKEQGGDLLARADDAMYKTKRMRTGRERFRVNL
ncbi:MAG: GGDEF domain-containing protein [Rhodospirillaceae bacterium]|nr:GGDEF domain-containing protein [Rhodospirillaceae bacterium]MBT5244180.1 GGDEF domain-containing protein [Rhodospirillaceae bacterium]MBT5561705.1 GGDEF domain-containing protein [Rhodospirillaceae bacterium]MBT6243144.1 GGDEF domain-containing protein [Rhodospirillaceae bacterium]MBT7137463.1 GGDEF domain-containing protein [Rhodospirillaceae bacterium]